MKQKKLFVTLLTTLFITMVGFHSCGGDPDFLRISQIHVDSQRITGQEERGHYQQLFLIVEPAVAVNDTIAISYDSLAFSFFSDFYLAMITKPTNGFGIKSAWAKRLEEYEKITEVTISSDKDYNPGLKAGANLTNIMLAHDGFSASGENVSTFLETRRRSDPFDQILFTLTLAPDSARVHNFLFRFITDKSSTFEVEIYGIKITSTGL
jgi:hypothetical protein